MLALNAPVEGISEFHKTFQRNANAKQLQRKHLNYGQEQCMRRRSTSVVPVVCVPLKLQVGSVLPVLVDPERLWRLQPIPHVL
jgi:hypothetical protein